jgi:hypothetical protein
MNSYLVSGKLHIDVSNKYLSMLRSLVVLWVDPAKKKRFHMPRKEIAKVPFHTPSSRQTQDCTKPSRLSALVISFSDLWRDEAQADVPTVMSNLYTVY